MSKLVVICPECKKENTEKDQFDKTTFICTHCGYVFQAAPDQTLDIQIAWKEGGIKPTIAQFIEQINESGFYFQDQEEPEPKTETDFTYRRYATLIEILAYFLDLPKRKFCHVRNIPESEMPVFLKAVRAIGFTTEPGSKPNEVIVKDEKPNPRN